MSAITTSEPVGACSPNIIDEFMGMLRELWWRAFPPKSGLETFAERELAQLLGDPDGDHMQIVINRDVLALVRRFARQGHSGGSAGYAINLLQKLLRYEPLRPLTGLADEWTEIGLQYGGDECWQNQRCSHVFKGADGKAYDIQGKVFVEPNGVSYTSRRSRVAVKFPYTPKTAFIYVDEAGKVIPKADQA